MKAIKLAIALAALGTAASTQNLHAEPQPRWLVAQIPTCNLDGRQVPAGANFCREGFLWVCSGGGTWTNTNKRC